MASISLPIARVITPADLASIYREASNAMRNLDGLQPQDAFDELLKYLFLKQSSEIAGTEIAVGSRRLNLGAAYDNGETPKRIRAAFGRYLKESGNARALWGTHKFRLSDGALVALHEAFDGVNLTATGFDLRSAALREFLSPDLRKGLGIFLTPDSVVSAIVAAASPLRDSKVYDPACGTGTFLIETLKFWRATGKKGTSTVYGSDLNARMMMLAELNISHAHDALFHGKIIDALDCRATFSEWPSANAFDYIFTNPPFGAYVDPKGIAHGDFLTRPADSSGRIQSEVLFIERCLRLLKPKGLLAIVLPRSVVTNSGLAEARAAIDTMASLRGVLNLPPETFGATGTQTTTSVLFFKKRSRGESQDGEIDVPVIDVTNVGYDSTGRECAGNQLEAAAVDLRETMRTGTAHGLAKMVRLPAASALAQIGKSTGQRSASNVRRRLRDIIVPEHARTGRTPSRAAYVADDSGGIFVVKVGNLTGQGIDWMPRDRNFVKASRTYNALLLEVNDIVLTSSAHNRRYIAQKVDIVQTIPSFVGGRASFVGEVLRLRPLPGAVDPFALLAFLRAPRTRAVIQEMISGQTAHLKADDLIELPIPDSFVSDELTDILRRETELSREMNLLACRQQVLLDAIGFDAAP